HIARELIGQQDQCKQAVRRPGPLIETATAGSDRAGFETRTNFTIGIVVFRPPELALAAADGGIVAVIAAEPERSYRVCRFDQCLSLPNFLNDLNGPVQALVLMLLPRCGGRLCT